MLTLAALIACICGPLIADGKSVERIRGLLQGSPFLLVVSNLYLDAFDEQIVSRGYRLVRYGDDFLVLAPDGRPFGQASQTSNLF